MVDVTFGHACFVKYVFRFLFPLYFDCDILEVRTLSKTNLS